MRCLHTVSSCLLVFLVVESLCTAVSGIRWLSMAMSGSASGLHDVASCGNQRGLVKRQRQLCRRYFDLMQAVQSGALLAIVECQYQFSNRRWNCSTVNAASIFGNVLNQGTRESAFVHAISAAGVSHAVTRSCSSGQVDRCGCDRTVWGKSRKGDFEWAGCSDNIAYGNAFSKTFVDARERTRGTHADRALMNLHNNNAGRQVIARNMVVQCKCHGVSGSCEMKTCWRAMPSLRRIGEQLKEKFDGATEVVLRRIGTRRHLVPRHAYFKPHTDTDLVYLQASPDFCDPDPKSGSLGTFGRRCNRTSRAMDGCELMCCGRDFTTHTRVVIERCQCRFHWCCYVKCQTCERQVEENICN